MQTLKTTTSICPECYKVIDAKIIEENKKVYITKKCVEHGDFKEIYWADAELYKWADQFEHFGPGVENPAVTKPKEKVDCPHDCGLCKAHHSNTALANIIITNRCNLRCWYCFLNVGKIGKVYEPSLEEIGKQLDTLRAERPVPTKAIQITGGEPTVREDLLEIIRMCREKGFTHTQVNSNGIRLGNEPGLAKKMRDAGCNTVYMSFDGVTLKTNPWLEETKKAVENCRKASMGVVLVPCVIKGVNDHEMKGILDYALENSDIVRGINYQPVSFVGKMPTDERDKMRITIPELWKSLEEQTNGAIATKDFYPVSSVTAVTRLGEAISGKKELNLSAHQHCGMATYLFKDDKKGMIPITRFVDVDKFFKFADKAANEINAGGKLAKAKVLLRAVIEFNKIVDSEKSPKGFDMKSILINIVKTRSYKSLGEFHYKSLFVGTMHFMDPWNYDIERVKRCVIHYVVPGGKIIPFCAFNGLPMEYSVKMQTEHGETPEEYLKRTGRDIQKDLYVKQGAEQQTQKAT